MRIFCNACGEVTTYKHGACMECGTDEDTNEANNPDDFEEDSEDGDGDVD